MQNKQQYISTNTKPDHNLIFNQPDQLNSTGIQSGISGAKKTSVNNLLSKLHEMEELNAKLQRLLEEQTKELTDEAVANRKFLSILAHDLRSPFSSIIGVLELIKDSLGDYKINELENYISIASASANSTLSLLDSLLTWTLSQSNKEKNFNPVKINLHELINDEIICIAPLAKQKQIIVSQSVSPSINVTGDLQMVKTILRNLISNAIKYTNPDGLINIAATENEKLVEIMVEDNGIGMSPEIRKTLFKIDKFHSTEGTLHEKGTGLGLMLCKEFVEIHGGNIQIESEPGFGSKFKFTLPHYL